jgi:hypothetical protein
LIANELRSYREVIATAIRQLRPNVEVIVTEPNELDASVERLCPDLVVCSKATDRVRSGVHAWIELYPDNEAQSVVSIGGRHSTVETIQFSDLLSIVDQVVGV